MEETRKPKNFDFFEKLHHNNEIHHPKKKLRNRKILNPLDTSNKTSFVFVVKCLSHFPFSCLFVLSLRCLSFYGIFNMLLITAAIIDYLASFVLRSFHCMLNKMWIFFFLLSSPRLRDVNDSKWTWNEWMWQNIKKKLQQHKRGWIYVSLHRFRKAKVYLSSRLRFVVSRRRIWK